MNKTLKGMAMAGLAAVFWGSMGVAGQYLLQNCHFTPMDLISIRMLLAGSIFVGIEFFLLKKGALKVFETKQNIIDLIIYTLTIIGTQLTFFVCIQYANAPFAAVLTATVPLWIMIFMVVFQHKRLTVKEVFCGLVAVAGVVLVVTGGSFKNFNVSGIGFWAGIGSGSVHVIVFEIELRRQSVPGKIPPLPPAKKQSFNVRDSSHSFRAFQDHFFLVIWVNFGFVHTCY